MPDNRYNRVLLTPENEEEQRLFMDFRSADIIDMHFYGCLFTTLMLLLGILAFFSNTSTSTIKLVLLPLFLTLIRWLAYVLGKRFPSKMNYMILTVFILETLYITIGNDLIVN